MCTCGDRRCNITFVRSTQIDTKNVMNMRSRQCQLANQISTFWFWFACCYSSKAGTQRGCLKHCHLVPVSNLKLPPLASLVNHLLRRCLMLYRKTPQSKPIHLPLYFCFLCCTHTHKTKHTLPFCSILQKHRGCFL